MALKMRLTTVQSQHQLCRLLSVASVGRRALSVRSSPLLYRPAVRESPVNGTTVPRATNQRQRTHRTIHNSASKQHSSTTSMNFTHSAPRVISKAECERAPYPSMRNLRALFVASAIPMVGFGAMDNIVSGFIDSAAEMPSSQDCRSRKA